MYVCLFVYIQKNKPDREEMGILITALYHHMP